MFVWRPTAAAATALAVAGIVAIAAVALAVSFIGIAPRTIVTGEADVGGPFELVDQTGRTVTDKDFSGRVMLVYFGWTRDPDLTPASLQVMAQALDRLGRDGAKIAAIFISLDPVRDTPQVLAAHLGRVAPAVIGLSGNAEAIAALSKRYRVQHNRIDDPQLPGGYSIEHQSLYYIMDRNGRFAGHLEHGSDANELVAALRKALDH